MILSVFAVEELVKSNALLLENAIAITEAIIRMTEIVREHNTLIHNVDIYARGVGTLMLNSVITWSIARFNVQER